VLVYRQGVVNLARRGYSEGQFYHEHTASLLKASHLWHTLVPDRTLNDEVSLRAAFDKLDLKGNGKIDAIELKQALLTVTPSFLADIADIDASVNSMIGFADMDADGQVDYEEYKRIIKVGCTPSGRWNTKKPDVSRVAPAVASPEPVIHL